MASDSDMESVSISELESEGEDVITPRVTSQPPIPSPKQSVAPQSSSSQPPTKRMTMRDRAAALREARMRRELGKSGINPDPEATEAHDKEDGGALGITMNDDDTPLKPLHVSRKDVTRKKVSKKASSQTDDDVLMEGPGSKDDTEHLRTSGAGRTVTSASKSGTSKSGRGRKAQSRKDESTGKTPKAQAAQPKTTPISDEEPQSEPSAMRALASSSQNPPSKGVGRSHKASSAKRTAEKKRKAAAVSTKDEKPSDANADIIVLDTTKSAPPASRQPKKAKLEKPKSTGPSKAAGKSQSKKKAAASEQASGAASAVDKEGLTLPQDVKGQADANKKEPKSDIVTSRRKKVSKKTAREVASAADEDEPIFVDETHANGAAPKAPLQAEKETDKAVGDKAQAAQPLSPPAPKRGRGRPRKHPKPESVDSHLPAKAPAVGSPGAKASKEQEAAVSPRHSPRMSQASKGRRGKQLASVDLEKEQGIDDEDVVLLDQATPAASRQPGSKLKRRSPPARAAKKVSASQPEEMVLSAKDVEMSDAARPKDDETEGHVLKQGSGDSAGVSGAKKKRVSIKLGASPRALGPKMRVEMRGAARRQSLSHEEGLSRLTAAVDQLQHNGEAFLHTQHRVCDQLAPAAVTTQGSIVSYLSTGSDRKTIADASLCDAVTHAKLVYQRQQRAAISELAENLVKAMKDWKNEKNAFLRDMIPDELRPKGGHGSDDDGARFRADSREGPEQATHGGESEQAGVGATAGGGRKAQDEVDMIGQDVEMEDDGDSAPTIREGFEGVKLMPAGFTECRKAELNKIPVMTKVEQLKRFVGHSYDKLRLGCYRAASILKLCENVGGLTFEELYGKTPLGRAMLRKKVTGLMDEGYLLGETVEGENGQKIELFYTAPHISEKV